VFSGVLTVSRAGGTTVAWTPGGETIFDVLHGDLRNLRGDCDHNGVAGDCPAGSFAAAMAVCLAKDTAALSVADLSPGPPVGGSWFHLLRGVAACGSGGTFSGSRPPPRTVP
jgi:hypothetical protein